MTYDGGNSYAYDFQGRPVTVNSTSFIYDAFGRVAEEDVPGTVTHILYQPDGSRFATLQNGSIQNYFMPMVNGMVEVFNASGEQYIRHADWLGSSRLATNPNGNPVYDRAYAPFGETYAETGTADRFFTGNTQDVIKGQTGIYDFLFREHSAGMGRWLSPDPAGLAAVDITNPQTWNRYAYVGNNPLSNVDPVGFCPKGTHQANSKEAQAVADTAMTYVGQNLSHDDDSHYAMVGGQLKQIDCSGLVCQAMNGNPFANPYTWDNHNVYGTGRIPSVYDPAAGAAVGNLICFRATLVS